MSIPFTQYLRPDGRKKAVEIDRPPEIEAKARELIAAGYKFEIEELTTGEISMTCEWRDEEQPTLAIKICANGPAVLDAVDRLVAAAWDEMKRRIGVDEERRPG